VALRLKKFGDPRSRATGSVMKRKPPGLPATVRTPENIERVGVAVLRLENFKEMLQEFIERKDVT
jgi:hypothetical protein